MNTPPLTLGTVLSLSMNNFKRLLPKFFIGALVFGIILGLVQSNMGPSPESLAGLESLGDSLAVLEEAAESGDFAAIQEAAEAMEGSSPFSGGEVAMMAGMAGVSMLFILLMMLIQALATLFYFNVSLGENGSFGTIINTSLKKLVPYILLSIVLMIISFIWIPLLGVIIAIIVMPRVMFSVMILLSENKGIVDSIKQSWHRTNGYWLKIVGYTIVTVIVLAIIGFIIASIVEMIVGVGMIGGIISGVIGQLFQAFMVVFVVVMGTLIFAHPKAVATTAAAPSTVVDGDIVE